jgi:hypothetical protein
MYIQNRRNSSKFKGCSPHQNCNGLISLKSAIAYFAYCQRWQQPKQTSQDVAIKFKQINEIQ